METSFSQLSADPLDSMLDVTTAMTSVSRNKTSLFAAREKLPT
jgi:hypothetical protein